MTARTTGASRRITPKGTRPPRSRPSATGQAHGHGGGIRRPPRSTGPATRPAPIRRRTGVRGGR